MGVSTDAILFFGWDLEDVDWWELSGADVADDALFSEEAEDACDVADDFEYRCNKEAEELKLTLGYHCSYDYPMRYLAIEKQCASRGESVEVKERKPSKAKIKLAKQFAKDWGLPIEGEPKWLLVSMWG